MEYQLTEEAKELAKLLVQAWDEGKITKSNLTHWTSSHIILMPQSQPRENFQNFDLPSKYDSVEFTELERCELIEWRGRKLLLLFPKLRNAVRDNFVEPVNPSVITVNGHIGSINSNSTITNQQNIGVNQGVVNMTSQEIADELTTILGQEFVNSHADLRGSIDELRQSGESEKRTKARKVVSVIGGIIAVTANISTIILTALTFLAPLL